MMQHWEKTTLIKKVNRLQIAVVILSCLFVVSVSVSIWSAMQIRIVSNSLPNYHEIKEDIKTLNNIYQVTSKKAPAVYNYTKEKAETSYTYTKGKVNDLVDYFKKDKEKKK